MNEYDCRRIVYSSSATVYGTPPIIPIPETTRLEAHSPYGKTKVMVETIIEDLCQCAPKNILRKLLFLTVVQRIRDGEQFPFATSSGIIYLYVEIFS